MGSYNVACSISNISIGPGTPIVFIPLEGSKYGGKKAIEDGNFSLIYSHCIYSPVTLPIFGEYNDYGGIENIERNANVETVEKFFGNKIENICDIESSPKQITSGMFVIREIYEALITNPLNEWGKKKGYGVETIESMKMGIEEWQRKMIEHYDGEERWNKDFPELVREIHPFSHVLYAFIRFREFNTFLDIYASQVQDGKLFDELAEFAMFTDGMFATNNHFSPAMNGYQCGNHYMSRKLYMKSLEIVRRIIKESKNDD